MELIFQIASECKLAGDTRQRLQAIFRRMGTTISIPIRHSAAASPFARQRGCRRFPTTTFLKDLGPFSTSRWGMQCLLCSQDRLPKWYGTHCSRSQVLQQKHRRKERCIFLETVYRSRE